MSDWLTREEVASTLKLNVRTLLKWRKAGQGPPCHLVGNKLRYDSAELDAWVRSRPAVAERRP